MIDTVEARMQNRAAELRGERGRKRVFLYELGAKIGMSPGRLGAMLNERLPLRPELADRIAEALRALPARRSR